MKNVTVAKIIDTLSLEVLHLHDPDVEISGGYCGDLLSWVMGKAGEKNLWVTIMNNINIIAVASLLEFSCIVLADDTEVSAELIKTAASRNINLLRSKKNSFDLCREIGNQLCK